MTFFKRPDIYFIWSTFLYLMRDFKVCETGSIVRTDTVLFVIIKTFVSKGRKQTRVPLLCRVSIKCEFIFIENKANDCIM